MSERDFFRQFRRRQAELGRRIESLVLSLALEKILLEEKIDPETRGRILKRFESKLVPV